MKKGWGTFHDRMNPAFKRGDTPKADTPEADQKAPEGGNLGEGDPVREAQKKRRFLEKGRKKEMGQSECGKSRAKVNDRRRSRRQEWSLGGRPGPERNSTFQIG